MQTLITSFVSLQLVVLLFVFNRSGPSYSTFTELELIRQNQTYSVNHVAPAAKRLHQKFVLWLS